jgi:hypothetical protein
VYGPAYKFRYNDYRGVKEADIRDDPDETTGELDRGCDLGHNWVAGVPALPRREHWSRNNAWWRRP